ncbi:DUF2461 domain-containing protein [Phytoactinopolyspora limicola]|uniref:DUF2461 domain-containing protein n=1 Tax=Phytoactinopolyspora limicola TaxID=2715536 RepID=UPI0014081EA9|nr:DUF2461 domain-containing protein [Phytoactinopolyspora limicola]
MSGFDGLPPELFTFFERLRQDNSREFWDANKSTWVTMVHDPFEALLAELAGEFPPMRMFRPHRDVRFSKDKSPYKLWVGATSESRAIGGTGYYLRVDESGLATGYGSMVLARDQLRRFRAAIDDDHSGRQFEELTTQLATASLPVTFGAEPPLKTSPPGYPKTHPRIEHLRWKGAAMVKEYDRADWMYTRQALDTIRGIWRAAEPLKQWMDTHVGASVQPVAGPNRSRK